MIFNFFFPSGKPLVTGRSAINFATKFFINFFRDYSRHLINSVHVVYSISDGTVFDCSLYSSDISDREHGTTLKKWRKSESDGKKKWREIESGDRKKWRKIDCDGNSKWQAYKNWRKHVRKWSLIGWQERNDGKKPRSERAGNWVWCDDKNKKVGTPKSNSNKEMMRDLSFVSQNGNSAKRDNTLFWSVFRVESLRRWVIYTEFC